MKTKQILDTNGRLYAVVTDVMSKEDTGTVWLGNEYESLQAGVFKFDSDKSFKKHKHILRPRICNYTQECITVFSGRLGVDIYDNSNKLLWSGDLTAGQLIITYRGYHYYRVMEQNTRFTELKNGNAYCSVDEDKTYD